MISHALTSLRHKYIVNEGYIFRGRKKNIVLRTSILQNAREEELLTLMSSPSFVVMKDFFYFFRKLRKFESDLEKLLISR